MRLFTFPSEEQLHSIAAATPAYMHPNTIPAAVIFEGALTVEECQTIRDRGMTFPGYHHPGCNAFTRELGHIPELEVAERIASTMNDAYWHYDLDPEPYTWMQTYLIGGDYQKHLDIDHGRMRKLTAVVFLTDENEYEGGDLEIFYHPVQSVRIPRTQGTIVCFQPWLLHQVHPIRRGIRQSLNMSFWGPDFR